VLRAAFNSSFVEGQTQTYRLNDIGPDAFRLLVLWLYSQKIDVHLEDDLVARCKDGKTEAKEIAVTSELEAAWSAQDLALVQLWVAADRLLMPRLQNAVLLTLDNLWNNPEDERHSTTGCLSYAYDHTSIESPLRSMVVDQFAFVTAPRRISERPDDIPREMLIDLALVLTDAVLPLSSEDAEYQHASPVRGLAKEIKPMIGQHHRYVCRREWRSYLVPEDK
jgi:hypothetical protein